LFAREGLSQIMKLHLISLALVFLVGCASIMVPDPSTKSLAEQEQDRAECAAVGARAAQDYGWDPQADLTTIRANREAVCLESRGYVTTTRVFMRPSPESGSATYDPPDPVRRCYQQAFAWMGRYDGPVDGHSNVIWTTAQKTYLTEIQVSSDAPSAPNLVRERLQQELQALGRAADWQTCLKEATEPR
jgi:hypothetical protein